MVPTTYEIGDFVYFVIDGKRYAGSIIWVDAFGTFFDNSQPYYDIQVLNTIFKHIPLSAISS